MYIKVSEDANAKDFSLTFGAEFPSGVIQSESAILG